MAADKGHHVLIDSSNVPDYSALEVHMAECGGTVWRKGEWAIMDTEYSGERVTHVVHVFREGQFLVADHKYTVSPYTGESVLGWPKFRKPSFDELRLLEGR